jgi:hypothetical protein
VYCRELDRFRAEQEELRCREARLLHEEVRAAAQANQQFMQMILINLDSSNNRETITPYGFN